MSAGQARWNPTEPFDAVIVGGGVIGLACAWRAARTGLRVRLIEREHPGAGASGVAAGMIAPVGESSWGEEALVREALAAHAAWPSFAAELAEDSGRNPGLSRPGALHAALDGDEAAELRRRYELMRSLKLDAAWLDSREARRLEPALSPNVTAAVLAPDEAVIDPRALIASLLAACEQGGVEVIVQTEVTEAIVEGDRLAGVRDGAGLEHRAAAVVCATGAWAGQAQWLPAHARPPVRPVKGQVLTLGAPSGRLPCERIIVGERVYLVPREDGRVVVGATVEEMGFDESVTAGGVHELLREAYRAVPEIAELELLASVAGLRPGTPDNSPLVGPGGLEGLLFATGHYRHGILLAPRTAATIAGLIGGGAREPGSPAAVSW